MRSPLSKTSLPTVALPSGRHTTRIGFGCSGLVGGVSARSSRALIDVALDVGFRHFDVAPLYGHGGAEDVLGEALKACVNEVTIATKAGIPRPVNTIMTSFIRAVVRPIVGRIPKLWNFGVQRIRSAGEIQREFNPIDVRRSVEDSLRRLQTDHLDFLLLHEVREMDVTPELVELMRHLGEQYKIDHIGVGTSADEAERIAVRYPELGHVRQLSWSVLKPSLKVRPGTFVIIHQSIREAFEPISQWLSNNKHICDVWSQLLNRDLSDKKILADLLLASALVENQDGLVLVSSQRADRIRRFGRVAADINMLTDGRRFNALLKDRAVGSELITC